MFVNPHDQKLHARESFRENFSIETNYYNINIRLF